MSDKLIQIGNHLFSVVGASTEHVWGRCAKCGRLVKLTGWTRGMHVCVLDDPRDQ